MAPSFHRNARCPHIGLKEGGSDPTAFRPHSSPEERAGRRRTCLGVAAAFPTGKHGQLIAQLQGRKGLGSDPSEASYGGGGVRWIVGTNTKRLSAEAFVAQADDKDEKKEGRSYRFTVGSEFRLTKGFWIEAAFGSDPISSSTPLREHVDR